MHYAIIFQNDPEQVAVAFSRKLIKYLEDNDIPYTETHDTLFDIIIPLEYCEFI